MGPISKYNITIQRNVGACHKSCGRQLLRQKRPDTLTRPGAGGDSASADHGVIFLKHYERGLGCPSWGFQTN